MSKLYQTLSLRRAKPVGAVSYLDINGFRLKRDVLFCYDLKFPEDFVPANEGKVAKTFLLENK